MGESYYQDYGVDFKELIDAQRCLDSFKHFAKVFWQEAISTEVIWNWHMDEICDVIQENSTRVFQGLPKLHDVIINVPPGTSKTMLVSILATAWELAKNPGVRKGIGSHSEKVILGISDKIKLIVQSDRYKRYFPNVKIRQDLNNKHNFKTSLNGEVWLFTVNSNILGLHFDIISLDDIIDPNGVKSATELYNINTTFLAETISSRKTDKEVTLTYLTMQRLSVKDPTGYLMELEPNTFQLCLPATSDNVVKPERLRAKYINGFLDPVRLNRAVLDAAKKRLTSKIFEAQYGQNPVPLGGNIIKQEWIRQIDYSDLPNEVKTLPVDMFIDTAMTTDKKNDPSAILFTVYYNNTIYVLNYWYDWLKTHDLVKKIAELGDEWCDIRSRIMIEKKANGIDTIDEITRIFKGKYNVLGLSKSVGKTEMLEAYAAPIESGKVVLLKGSWNSHFRDEICGFPAMPHDEAVDVITHACRYYFSEVKRERFTATA